MSQMYSSCTVCYNELSEEDKIINAERDNINFPVCKKCLNEASVDIDKTLKK